MNENKSINKNEYETILNNNNNYLHDEKEEILILDQDKSSQIRDNIKYLNPVPKENIPKQNNERTKIINNNNDKTPPEKAKIINKNGENNENDNI